MSEDDLVSKQKGVLDELFSRLQSKEAEIRTLTTERKKLQEMNDGLTRRLNRLEERLGDRERDHHVLVASLAMTQQSYITAVDHLDSMVSLLEGAKHRTDNTPDREAIENAAKIAEEYVAQVSRIRHMATNTYALKVQEGILIGIVKSGGLTAEAFTEVMRLAKNRLEYFTDGDNWLELQTLLENTE